METQKNTTHSPFMSTKTFGMNPFVRKGEVYIMNPTVVTRSKVLELLTESEKSELGRGHLRFFAKPQDESVIVCIIRKAFDDPFLGGVEAEGPEAAEQAKEVNDWLIEMNGIEFQREYYEHMLKKAFEGAVKGCTGKNPDDLSTDDFLYLFTINFFASYFFDKSMSYDTSRIEFFKDVYSDLNAFDYKFLARDLPGDRTEVHFIVWKK